MNKFNKLYKNIILEQIRFLDKYPLTDFIDFSESIFPIDQQILIKAFENIINESQDPDYFIKLPKEFLEITKSQTLLQKDEIVRIFPEVSNYNLPKVFIYIFDFGNEKEKQTFLKSISKIKYSYLMRLKINQSLRGCGIDLTPFNKNLFILLFNKNKYNQRTIYHQWTHYFQKFVKEDKFKELIQLHYQNEQKINQLLKPFNINLDFVQMYFLNQKEYITHLDNLLYVLHQAQKLDKYKNLNDIQFFNIFKSNFNNTDINCLNSEIAKDIINIKNDYKTEILFYISCFICLDQKSFDDLNINLAQRL